MIKTLRHLSAYRRTACRTPLHAACLVGLAGLVCLSPASVHANGATPSPTGFIAAMQDYEDNRWPVAFEHFARLADQGHRDAARMAWQMWRYGPELFAQSFEMAPAQRAHWHAVWRQTPGAMLSATDALDSASAGQ